jgi:hypothetical protein
MQRTPRLETRMDERVRKLRTPEECENFGKNAAARSRPDLANEALLRAIQLRAELYGPKSEVEREALQAVYAYEEVLSKKNGRRTRASRTWQMIGRHGIIGAVERAVDREQETQGYKALAEMNLKKLAFEAVVVQHPSFFSDAAVEKSKERLRIWDEQSTEPSKHSPFDDSDELYRRWLHQHPSGFVLNTRRTPSASYIVLHRATCSSISSYQGKARLGGFTERSYIKICADTVEGLRQWVRTQFGAAIAFSAICSRCNPET